MRQPTRGMFGTVCLAGLFLTSPPPTLPAEEPAKKADSVKPLWQRQLKFFDALKATAQEKKLALLQEAGQFAEALKTAEAVAELRTKAQGADHWQAINARFAVAAMRRVVKAKKEDQQSYRRALAMQRQAEALFANSRYGEAQPLFEQVLASFRKMQGEEHPLTIASFSWTGLNLNAQAKYPDAEKNLHKALALSRKLLGEDHPDTAKSYENLAGSLQDQGKYKEAEDGFRKALDIKRRVLGEEDAETATSYDNLAQSLNAQAKFQEAEEGFRKALDITRKLLGEKHPDTARSYNNVAANLDEQGRYQEAEENYRKALVIFRKVLGEDHLYTARAYHNVAGNLQDQGRYREAEEIYRKALAVKRKVLGDEHPETAKSHDNLAGVLQDQGKYKEAEEGRLKALAIRRKVLGEENPETAISYSNVATTRLAQSRFKEAEQGYRKALAIELKALGEDHPGTAKSYNNLGYSQSAQGKHEAAEENYRKALTIKCKALGEEHADTATSYDNLAASLLAQGKYREAEAEVRKALAIRRKVLGEGHLDTAKSSKNVAYHLSAQGKYQEAEEYGLLAAKVFDRARLHIAASGLKRAAITTKQSPLPALAALLARNGKPNDAWQRFEESLARGTWDDFTARLRWPQAERAQQARLGAGIGRLNQLLAEINAAKPTREQTKQRDELLSQLPQAYDDLAAFTRKLENKYGAVAGQVSPRSQIQKALPADAALVAWLDLPSPPKAKDPNGEHWAILLRSSGDPIWVRLAGSGDKNAWTEADTRLPQKLRAALPSSTSQWQPLAERLRRQRLDSLAPHLKDVRRLVVLPSTAMAGVPLEAIAAGYTVSYAHSGTMYAHLRQKATPTGTGLFALADPVFDAPPGAAKPQPRAGGEDALDRLPGTRAEVAALQRLFGSEPPRVLLDSEASEQRLNEMAQRGELGKYRYLHLATHGEVNDDFPLRSAVILSRDRLPDDKQRTELLLSGQPIPDGRLEAEEVLRRWELHADLVTLSACQTALGKYESGEGFVGFAQALILCGTRSVCLSLWRVDDRATALLMERFYQNLLGKRDDRKAPMTKAAALAEAKNWLRTLPREEAEKRVASLSNGVDRGKRKLAPLEVAPAAAEKSDCPFAHPYYWAAFVLVGHAD